jgi:putative ABC transport system permease protein
MLEIKDVTKIYINGEVETKALNEVSLKFRSGEFVAVLGPSGCGKTTLLNIIGGLDRYTSGDLIINGRSTKKFKDNDWDSYRNNSIGFVFQSYNLISHISILENVEMGMTLSGKSLKERRKKAIEVLTRVGLADQVHKKSAQLSGGQKQRAAIARALANDPDVILADEPTGALDTKTSEEVMKLIQEISKEKLVIMVTHNQYIAKKYASRLVKLRDGKVIEANEPDENHDEEDRYHLVNTAMKFTTALKLSFNNLKTKLGRTLITALAGSIGIIGVALVLAISNGFQGQLNILEEETLSTLPITITEIPNNFGPPPGINDGQALNETEFFDPKYDAETERHYNVIDDDYLSYLDNIDNDLVSSIQYNYGVQFLMLSSNNGNIVNSIETGVFFQELSNSDAYINGQFNLVEGSRAETENEVMIIVDMYNQIDSTILEFLGFDPEDDISFNDVIGKEIVVAYSDDFDRESDEFGEPIFVLENDAYDNGIPLSISGVLKAKEDGLEILTSGIFYHDELELTYIENNQDSLICALLNARDTSVFNPDELSDHKLLLHTSGCIETPLIISIYPATFQDKGEIIDYLDAYNLNLPEDEQILYTDLASAISGLMGNIINSISIVLVAFAAISLVVSSIMIGIITYISVLERTKEIGILRSLGARKKDISRVFNAESFIIGLLAGLIGVIFTFIISIPLNIVLENVLDGFENIAKLRIDHAIYLVLISISLTFIAGLIPSRLAAKKDPVSALRHNE